jgi:hypothetical protein
VCKNLPVSGSNVKPSTPEPNVKIKTVVALIFSCSAFHESRLMQQENDRDIKIRDFSSQAACKISRANVHEKYAIGFVLDRFEIRCLQ